MTEVSIKTRAQAVRGVFVGFALGVSLVLGGCGADVRDGGSETQVDTAPAATATTTLQDLAAPVAAGSRESLNWDWRFALDEQGDFSAVDFDDSAWRVLNLPHDFSIEGEVAEDNPGSIQNGFYPAGVGWYRKALGWRPEWEGQRVIVTFDGIMMRSDVYVNGERLGGRNYGYLGVEVDVTDALVPGGDNVIAVRADNEQVPSGRWYTGSGIYRNVWLDVRAPQHLALEGSWVKTVALLDDSAQVRVETEAVNTGDVAATLTVKGVFVGPDGAHVADFEAGASVVAGGRAPVTADVTLADPALWAPGAPNLYRVELSLYDGETLLDQRVIPAGVRTIDISVENGLLINGQPFELQGVCEHHDAGAVGAAVPEDVLRRRMTQLKDMGVNAIRVGHTPFAPEFYAIADELGLMVMDEAFDGWEQHKARYDYGHFFEDDWEEDLTNFVLRSREHPSIIFWSVGNEVPKKTAETQKKLVDLIKSLDDTRPVTQGEGGNLGHLDAQGFNGHGEFMGAIQNYHRRHPNLPIIGTEITHTLHTRDVYRSQTEYRTRDNPAPWEIRRNNDAHHLVIWERMKDRVFPNPDLTEEEVWPEEPLVYASSFDNNLVRMSIRDSVRVSEELTYYLGAFRWTGFDYLGESFGWPARTTNFGVLDLAGFEKGAYYLYQSLWSDEPMVYVDPHWTHPGKEGVLMPVVAYTNLPEAELFLNGVSQGRLTIEPYDQLVWQVPYTPGSIKVVAYGEDGSQLVHERHTAGEPAALSIETDRQDMPADGKSVVFVEIDVVDADGVRVPWADDRVFVEIDGPGTLIGIENGDIQELQSVKDDNRKVFRGKVMALVQSQRGEAGDIVVTARAEGLQTTVARVTASSQ